MAKKPKEVAFVIAQCPHTGLVLMGLRSMWSKNGGKWNFFGGHLKRGESPEFAAVREFAEETGIVLHAFALNLSEVFYFPERTIWLYRASVYHKHPIKLNEEHSEYRWWDVDQIGNLLKGKLNPPAKQILTALSIIKEM